MISAFGWGVILTASFISAVILIHIMTTDVEEERQIYECRIINYFIGGYNDCQSGKSGKDAEDNINAQSNG